MKKILNNSIHALSLPQGDILSAGFTIMFLSLLSGLFGLIRDRLLATHFSPDLVGIYFAAFVIPDNIFQILVLSAIGAAFIPVFAKYERGGNQWEFVNSLLHTSILIFLAIIAIVVIFIEPLSSLLVADPKHMALLVNLTRIILLSQIFFVLSYLCTGLLQSYQRFFIPATGAILYNIGIIVGLLVFAPIFGMYGVALGIILGAFFHFLIQLPFVLQLGYRYGPPTRLFHPGLVSVGKLMAPRSLSIGLERLALTILTRLASVISLASITFYNFASHVAVFPVSLFAAAIAQAALPFLVKAVSSGNMDEFKKQIILSLTHIAFFLGPTSVLLIVLHTPIVRLIFGAPRFDWEATFLTSWTLVFLAFGLFPQGAGTLLARGFYALFDTKTPLIMTFISSVVTIVLSLIFVLWFSLPVWSLGLATSIGASVNGLFLFILLDRKVGGLDRFTLLLSLLKILITCLFLGIFSYMIFKSFEVFFNTNYALPLLVFTIIVAFLGGLFYLFLSFVFNLEEYQALFALIKRARILRQKLLEETI